MLNPCIVRSLNKSNLRKQILLHLYSVGDLGAYLTQIARSVKSDEANVTGCLRGLGARYSEDYSLINLGLVEIIKVKKVKIYKVTEFGCDVAKSLEI